MAHLLTRPWRLAAAVMLAVAIVLPRGTAAQPVPPELTGPVNDFATVVDRASAEAIGRTVAQLQAASGDVVVVATIATFKPHADLASYAARMFENHGKGIGGRKGDSGVLIVVAVNDRQVWIEVGYGLEEFITDGFAGDTSREVMAPHFRRGEYGRGLLAGVTRVVERIAEGRGVTVTAVPVETPAPRRRGGGINPIVVLLLAFLLINLLNAGRTRRRRRGRWTSGVGGFGAGWGAGSMWGRSSGGMGGFGGFGGSGGGFGGFGGGRSGGGGGGASW